MKTYREMTVRSDILNIFQERGFINQVTDLAALDQLALKNKLVGYIGFGCTASSLHVGSLVQIMMLRWLQKTGNNAIVLLGEGTTKIGDPSGKSETRKLLTIEQIKENLAGIHSNFCNFLNPITIVNNAEWLDDLNYVAFLRDVGQHFSVNRMLTMDSVKLRLDRDQPLSFLEFNYMLLQAYDFAELAKRYDCNLQMGGSDQWGNIVMGVDLGRRLSNAALYGITTQLITTASGNKMGKTESGTVWLSSSPYDYFQFWRNTEDKDVGKFLRLFTEIPIDEIRRLEQLQGVELNEAKRILARETVKLLHGFDSIGDLLAYGKTLQWWDDYTDEGEPLKYHTAKVSDYSNKTMAHLLSDLKFFPSVGQAKKNGWDKPVVSGIYKIGKNKRVRIEA